LAPTTSGLPGEPALFILCEVLYHLDEPIDSGGGDVSRVARA
jgi:hypothetical protein